LNFALKVLACPSLPWQLAHFLHEERIAIKIYRLSLIVKGK
jgi:hypothetical protein